MKIIEFIANAEVLGTPHKVVFHGDALVIEGLDVTKAEAILEALNGKSGVKAAPDAAPVKVEAPKPAKAPKAKAEPVKVETKPEPEQQELPNADPAPVVSTKAKPAAKPVTAAAGEAPDLPDNIRNASSMRDLLAYLSSHGANDVDTLVAQCKALKDTVPILGKVPDVEGRVRRAVEVLGLFAGPEEADDAGA